MLRASAFEGSITPYAPVMNRASFAHRHPSAFVAILVLTVLLGYGAAGIIARSFDLSRLAFYGAANILLSVVPVVLLTRMNWWKVVGFRWPSHPLVLGWFSPALLPVWLNLRGGIALTYPARAAAYAALALLVGFTEEAFYRGLMLQTLAPRGLRRAAVLSSLLFGLMHGLNAFAGADPQYVLVQITYAFALALMYAGLVLRTGIIWPLMIAHFLTDLAGFLGAGGLGMTERPDRRAVMFSMLQVVAYAAYGAFLLRPGGLRRTGTNTES